MPTTHGVVLIPGDGIGPEVTAAVRKIFAAAQAPIEWHERLAGLSALEAGKAVLPEETLEAIVRHQTALKGPCTTPVGEGFTSINVQLRKKLNLYAAVRPVLSLPGVVTWFENVDLIIIRENTEGLYSGVENQITDDAVMSMKVATHSACQRIARWAFRHATQRRRRKIPVRRPKPPRQPRRPACAPKFNSRRVNGSNGPLPTIRPNSTTIINWSIYSRAKSATAMPK